MNFSSPTMLSLSPGLTRALKGAATVLLLAACAMALNACSHDDGDKKPGQALARVNGEELTVYQLNEEMRQSTMPDANPDAQRKQLLSALIDRQLLVEEAVRQKMDRDPSVMGMIERARDQILAQAYLQSKVGAADKPGKADVDAYYAAHPELFAQRKLFEMRQFVVASKDFSKELNTVMDNAKSLDEAAAWMDAHKIDYARSQMMRTSPELPAQILSKMQGADKTELFILHSDSKTLLMSVTAVKEIPVTPEAAANEIAQFLSGKRNQVAADAELKRLRSTAKIEYLNQEVAAAGDDKPVPSVVPNLAPSVAPSVASGAQAKSDVDPKSIK